MNMEQGDLLFASYELFCLKICLLISQTNFLAIA